MRCFPASRRKKSLRHGSATILNQKSKIKNQKCGREAGWWALRWAWRVCGSASAQTYPRGSLHLTFDYQKLTR